MIAFLDILRRRPRPSLREGFAPAGVMGSHAMDFRRLRAPPSDADRVLQSETHLWLRRIPGRLQPKQLCRFYPRVANRLAKTWDDPVAFHRLLHDLLTDRRGGRAGFPPRIVVELQVIGRLRERQQDASWRTRLRGYTPGRY